MASKTIEQYKEFLSLVRSVGSTDYRRQESAFKILHEGQKDTDISSLLSAILNELSNINEKIIDMTWLNEHLRILHDFGRTCSQTLNEKVLMEKAYHLVSRVMPTDSFFIALYEEGNQKIQIPFMMDDGEFLNSVEIPFDDNSFTVKVIKSKETIHGKTAQELDEFNYIIGKGEGNTCIYVPLVIDDQVKGVISAQSNREFAYRKEHEDLLQIIGNQVISSIITARLYTMNYEMSLTDEMTGLGNYRAFHSDLEATIQNSDAPVSLLMIDSDGLKNINDQYGHHAGDLYLKAIANGMKSLCGSKARAYRYAGDEFMFIIPNAETIELSTLFKDLCSYLNQNPIYIRETAIIVSISGGGAIYPLHAHSSETLKKNADIALYKAKRTGKNQFVLYSNEKGCSNKK
ncbi:diguanylate cyclase (GGDEF)-like protein [Peribacillus deserti]|uniref:Diguanylate cyclase (GGDEF)-like protein n=1 Tax=Peribacillus deserti TaxID=673318 RepID=A0ABS2QE28_9BACI|nr:GGDEF domain-containing protein [Peribacillus deserti]MBM7691064.1 diguanylate cyclase (GGDEF)-like protein [Peribacillus deserti]